MREEQQVLLGLVNDRSLKFECARVLHESLLMPVLTWGRETVIWREKERSRIRAVQMNNLRGLLLSGEWIKSQMH